MTENEAYKFIGQAVIESGKALEALQSIKSEAERIGKIGEYYANLDNCVREIEACRVAMQALEEIQQYRALEQRLQSVYGKHDGLLEIVVNGLVKYEGTPDTAIKCVLLTDDDVDRWEAYKASGTVEECRTAVERMKPRKPNQISKAMDKDKFVGLIGRCPNCGSIVAEDYLVCEDCFQVLDWSE